MDVILVRYAEVGLKSRGVRRFFERVLVNNMLNLLVKNKIEAIITVDQGRLFVETERIDEAVEVLSKVFGIASLSPALKTGSRMEEMQRAAAEYSQPLLKPGDGFAIRARREGDHPYTSQDVGREVGSAVYLANEDEGIHVDLSKPDVEIFIEVRRKNAYIFSKYVPGPAGLPMGSQGRVVALVEEDKDAVAAWLLMKRGCKTIIVSNRTEGPISILDKWDPNLKVIRGMSVQEAVRQQKALAAVFGHRLADFGKIRDIDIDVPEFYPLIGMDDQEIEERMSNIR